MPKTQITQPIFFGIGAGLSLLVIYLLIMSWGAGSLNFAIKELIRLKYFVTPLILGFGVQVGLFTYLKSYQKKGLGKGMVAGSGATSTVAMVACCAHHLTDILPLLGLTVLSTFLVKYQTWFLSLGIFSNLLGIGLMFKHLKKLKDNEK
ncbi:hypothetical protein HY385_01285 [Candidatus Daviesbacteria bacterium]|nr:hypothetical protein [Candidatus Daviesbacteria bacterium]